MEIERLLNDLFKKAVKFPEFMSISQYIQIKYEIFGTIQKVYHYTDIEGVKGIIEDNCFWATNINFMNDSKEFQDGLQLCYQVIDDLYKIKTNEKEKAYLDEIKKSLQEDGGGISINIKNDDIFGISFCEDGDLLSQWRGYGKGGGISIGFDVKKLSNIFAVDKNKIDSINEKVINKEITYDESTTELLKIRGMLMNLSKVVYKNEKKRNIVEEVINIGRNSLKDGKFKDAEISAKGVSEFLKYIIPFLKDNGFKEECEYRFVEFFSLSHADERYKVYFRTRNDIIIPFLKLKMRDMNVKELDELPINDIIVGPSKNQDFIIKSLKYFLIKSGCEYLVDKIRCSEIPYRE